MSNLPTREDYIATCRGCGGRGEDEHGRICSICRGDGEVEYLNPDKVQASGGSYSKNKPTTGGQRTGVRRGKLNNGR